jgi:hypothetical protein
MDVAMLLAHGILAVPVHFETGEMRASPRVNRHKNRETADGQHTVPKQFIRSKEQSRSSIRVNDRRDEARVHPR